MTVLKKNFFPSAEQTLFGRPRTNRVSKYNFDLLVVISDPTLGIQGDFVEFCSTLNGNTQEEVRKTADMASSAANIYMKRNAERFKEHRISVRTYDTVDSLGNVGRACGAGIVPRR
jgi:hypothetical protein